jgi:hypothetical protein
MPAGYGTAAAGPRAAAIVARLPHPADPDGTADPLGTGSNPFGTAKVSIHYGVISSTGIWYVQALALIAGHVTGLCLAHDRALALYRNPAQATRSQHWMLGIMVGFTSLGLWLLSAIAT